MTNSKIGHISAARLFVHDIKKAKEFYGKTLGLALNLHTPDCLIYKTGDAQLIVEPIERGDENRKSYVGRFTGIAFDVEDIAAVVERLYDAGVAFDDPPQAQDWGGIIVHFKDPDGNVRTLVEHG